jgi:hypothetical protein
MGTIGDASNLWTFLGSFPSIGEISEVLGPSTPDESGWIKKSEKVKEEDILALCPPVPQINFAAFQEIALHFPEHFRIGSLSSTDPFKSFGALESAITLAAAGTWAKDQRMQSELVKQLLLGDQKNPLSLTLASYVAHGKITPLDASGLLISLRNVPVLLASLRTVESPTVLQAFALAEQQITLHMLDKWVEMEAKLADLQKDIALIKNKERDIIARELLKDYLTKSVQKQEALSQPALSILLCATSAGLTPAVGTILPIAVTPTTSFKIISSIPARLQTELNLIGSGVLATSIAWATPIAMSLISISGSSQMQIAQDSAKAYAMTLTSFIYSKSVDDLIASRLDKALASGLIDERQAVLCKVAFKTSLLLNVMAILYKAQTGGVSPDELKAILNGSIRLHNDDFVSVIAKNIVTELAELSKEDAAKLLEDLFSQYDQTESLSSLTDPISVFIQLWDPTYVRLTPLATAG